MKNYHITKVKNGEGWNLKAEGSQRATLTTKTKAEIIKETREFAQGKEISVRIHTGDGRIQEERTYPRSSDPKKTPG